MRTFVAIELDEACRRRLVATVEVLRRVSSGVRWVKAPSMHLTLKFIGELRELDLPRAIAALGPAAASAEPFEMTVAGLSGFPPTGVPRVVHVDVAESTGTLVSLQRAVDAALEDELGLAREKRRYVPHVTLGRVKDRRAGPRMDDLASALDRQDFGTVPVDSMVLMKSDLRPDGAVYTPLHVFQLGDG
jgi:2'-5' RNA ligase